MNKIPNQSKNKDLPEYKDKQLNNPKETKLLNNQPEETPKLTILPEETEKKEIIPEKSKEVEIMPEASPEKEEKPSDMLEENCVIVAGEKRELKPTKLKYFRNKAASAYAIIKAVPLPELLTYGKGTLDETRDADQLLYDFLIAAFDDAAFVTKNYDEFDADNIDRICKIFGRLNHIDEKEEAARKNREAQAQAKR